MGVLISDNCALMGQHVNWHFGWCVSVTRWSVVYSIIVICNVSVIVNVSVVLDHQNIRAEITFSVLSCLVKEIRCKIHNSVMNGHHVAPYLKMLRVPICTAVPMFCISSLCLLQPDFTVIQDFKSPGVGAQFKTESAHPSNYQIS